MTIHVGPWPDGYPCWIDLGTGDREGACAFYAAVMDWQLVDTGAETGHYAIAMSDGASVAAIGQAQPGRPTAWSTYFATSDVDKTAELITAAGGTLIVPPGDVGPMGRLTIALDPTGAVFGAWQAGLNTGVGKVRLPGSMSWHDLVTRDPEAARAFYSAVFGWQFTPIGTDLDEYATVSGESPSGMICAIGAMDASVPAEVPAHWRVYFSVTDADAAVQRVRDGGGTVQAAPVDTPYGRMAQVTDPQGAPFILIDHAIGQMS